MDANLFYQHLWRCDLAGAADLLDGAHSQESGSAVYSQFRADLHYRASDFARALDLYIKLGRDFPGYLGHRYELVDACVHLGLPELAYAELRRLMDGANLAPGNMNQVLAEALVRLGRDEEVIALDPDIFVSQENRHVLLMMQGQSRMRSQGLESGLPAYRASYCTPDAWGLFYPDMKPALPDLWYGQRELPRRLQIHGRGGMGDALQWSRYIAVLERAGVMIEGDTNPWYHRLAAHSEQPADVLHQQGYRLGDSDALMWTDPFTLFASLFPVVGYVSGPRYLELSAPSHAAAWVAAARSRAHGKPCVGLFWSANESPGSFGGRSLKLHHLTRLLVMSDVHWVIFQRGCERDQWMKDARSLDASRYTTVPASLSFQESIGFASQLDALVCIDSGLLHACAALGTPCVLIANAVAEWRWGRASQTEWYPAVSIVRAPRMGAWEDAVAEVAGVLRQKIGLRPELE